MPPGHELAGRKQVSAAEIIRYPLIGIDPNDPYGRIMAEIFARVTTAAQNPPSSAPVSGQTAAAAVSTFQRHGAQARGHRRGTQ